MIGPGGDIGPSAPDRSTLHMQAREVGRLLQIVCEVTAPGPMLDMDRAQKLMNEARAKLGPMLTTGSAP